MSDVFVGQLALVGFNWAPYQWALANGALYPINSYPALFTLFQKTYGGDGKTNFGLPNLQGAVAIGAGQGIGLASYGLGQSGGATSVILSFPQTPDHNHTVMAKNPNTTRKATTPVGSVFAESNAGSIYSSDAGTPFKMMQSNALTPYTGGGGPHPNMMPYQGLNWIVSLSGIFPTKPQ
jgi:microcystin-dependent protein